MKVGSSKSLELLTHLWIWTRMDQLQSEVAGSIFKHIYSRLVIASVRCHRHKIQYSSNLMGSTLMFDSLNTWLTHWLCFMIHKIGTGLKFGGILQSPGEPSEDFLCLVISPNWLDQDLYVWESRCQVIWTYSQDWKPPGYTKLKKTLSSRVVYSLEWRERAWGGRYLYCISYEDFKTDLQRNLASCLLKWITF